VRSGPSRSTKLPYSRSLPRIGGLQATIRPAASSPQVSRCSALPCSSSGGALERKACGSRARVTGREPCTTARWRRPRTCRAGRAERGQTGTAGREEAGLQGFRGGYGATRPTLVTPNPSSDPPNREAAGSDVSRCAVAFFHGRSCLRQPRPHPRRLRAARRVVP